MYEVAEEHLRGSLCHCFLTTLNLPRQVPSTGRFLQSGLERTLLSSPSCIGLGQRDDDLHTGRKDRRSSSARVRTTTMAAAARQVTGEELEVEMTEWELPMILDVFATWCGPCVMLKPEIEKVGLQARNVRRQD